MLRFLVSPRIPVCLLPAVAGLVAQTPQPATVDLKTITVNVVDRESGAPITEFTYQASYDAPGHAAPPDGDVWTPVKATVGTFEIQATARLLPQRRGEGS